MSRKQSLLLTVTEYKNMLINRTIRRTLMKKVLVFALALSMALALVPGLTAQKKLTVWCWDPNFNG